MFYLFVAKSFNQYQMSFGFLMFFILGIKVQFINDTMESGSRAELSEVLSMIVYL